MMMSTARETRTMEFLSWRHAKRFDQILQDMAEWVRVMERVSSGFTVTDISYRTVKAGPAGGWMNGITVTYEIEVLSER